MSRRQRPDWLTLRPAPSQPAPTAEMDRSNDQVYHFVMELVKMVVQLKNDVNMLQPSEYVGVVKVRWDGDGRGGH